MQREETEKHRGVGSNSHRRGISAEPRNGNERNAAFIKLSADVFLLSSTFIHTYSPIRRVRPNFHLFSIPIQSLSRNRQLPSFLRRGNFPGKEFPHDRYELVFTHGVSNSALAMDRPCR